MVDFKVSIPYVLGNVCKEMARVSVIGNSGYVLV